MAVSPSDLRAIPLFQRITDEHLTELIGAFERTSLDPGTVLFEAGSEPAHLLLLVRGEVALKESDEIRFRLAPIAPIGELGAVTGLKRNTTAVTTEPSEVWRIGVDDLSDFFEAHGDVAFPLYHNLLNIVADKVRRDTRRLDEMRSNLIRTQKAMKRLLEQVLSTEETPLSHAVCETLEDLIEHNRRGHYMIEPAHTLQCSVRLDGGTVIAVREVSEDLLLLEPPNEPDLSLGKHVSFVLLLPGREVPVSGTVKAVDKEGTLIKLDLLIAEYAASLAAYLTRVHLLDFVA